MNGRQGAVTTGAVEGGSHFGTSATPLCNAVSGSESIDFLEATHPPATSLVTRLGDVSKFPRSRSKASKAAESNAVLGLKLRSAYQNSSSPLRVNLSASSNPAFEDHADDEQVVDENVDDETPVDEPVADEAEASADADDKDE